LEKQQREYYRVKEFEEEEMKLILVVLNGDNNLIKCFDIGKR